jgi:hypothetical protein
MSGMIMFFAKIDVPDSAWSTKTNERWLQFWVREYLNN